MPVNWKDPDAFTRLLAAMVAAQDMKLDYRKIASMYGNGATYDSIEGRFRIIRKDAAILKAQLDSGERPAAPARGAGAVSTPKKQKSTVSTPKKEKVMGGRVGKSNGTPSQKRGSFGQGIKEEPMTSSSSGSFVEAHSTTEEDRAFLANVQGGRNGVEGAVSNLYYDNEYLDDSMDVGAF